MFVLVKYNEQLNWKLVRNKPVLRQHGRDRTHLLQLASSTNSKLTGSDPETTLVWTVYASWNKHAFRVNTCIFTAVVNKTCNRSRRHAICISFKCSECLKHEKYQLISQKKRPTWTLCDVFLCEHVLEISCKSQTAREIDAGQPSVTADCSSSTFQRYHNFNFFLKKYWTHAFWYWCKKKQSSNCKLYQTINFQLASVCFWELGHFPFAP